MTRAWEIAREGAKKFGGKVKEYFQQALVIAWAEIKKGVAKVKTVSEMYKEAKAFSKENFDGYVATMKAKGVKVNCITADSAEMVAPNGLAVKAYVETSSARKENDVVTFYSTIFYEVKGGRKTAGQKKISF
jgi:hypothetical protein